VDKGRSTRWIDKCERGCFSGLEIGEVGDLPAKASSVHVSVK